MEQEEGWPLGLQPLNLRIGLGRSRDGSTSFNTSLSDSLTSSTDSSSDLDTEVHSVPIYLDPTCGIALDTLSLTKRYL